MASDTKRGSLSRLSPLARPFTLSKPPNSSFSPSSSALDRSFAYYPQYPSGVLQGSADFGLVTESKSDFDAVPTKSTEPGYEAHKSGDLRGTLHWKDKLGGFSMFNADSTKQGVLYRSCKLDSLQRFFFFFFF